MLGCFLRSRSRVVKWIVRTGHKKITIIYKYMMVIYIAKSVEWEEINELDQSLSVSIAWQLQKR